mmetsp:Transcript_12241/g.51217  ORF Transcript_12241/g.51217 Transcript_12241/m.51217 type:complete len:202 (+) Transcript_12241:2063-2668(+)
MSSSTSRSFKVHVLTKNRLSLEQKNQEEDLPEALALLMIRSEVWDGKKTSGRSWRPGAPPDAPPGALAFSLKEKAPSCDTTEKRSDGSFVRPSVWRLANIGSAFTSPATSGRVSSPETGRPRSSSSEIPSIPSESAPSSVSDSAPTPSEEPTEKSRACRGVVDDAPLDTPFFSASFFSSALDSGPSVRRFRARISSANDSA